MRDTVRWSMRRGRVLAAALLALAVVGAPTDARADSERVRFLAEKMRSDDFRVRTNAALALGATADEGAVEPLCGGLSDSSEVVRQASAVALKRLAKPSSSGCLHAREKVEPVDAVKTAITKALEAIGGGHDHGGGNDDHVKENPNAKYYIALSTVANSTGRAQPDVEKVVLHAIRQKLDGAGTVQLAPMKETPDVAKEKMSKRKLKGFYLAIAVDRFDYSDGNLRVKVKIGVFTYPGKALMGNVDKTLTAQGVSNPDHGSEDKLMEMAAGLASEQFAQNASAFL
jgi:hypothetical protein